MGAHDSLTVDDDIAGWAARETTACEASDHTGVQSGAGGANRRGADASRSMTAVDELWYLSDVAAQQAEQTHHRLADEHDDYLEFTRTRRVSRPRFRTVAERTEDNGLPYGAHVLVYRESGELLLVRHEQVGMWVLPGGEVDGSESFREAARRELLEEAGVDADFDGLGMLARVEFHCDGHSTWGVLPIFAGEARSTSLTVDDPDGEITDAAWFDELPEDARDRDQLERFRERRLE